MGKKITHDTNPVPERHRRSRRRLLKSLAAGGAAVTVKSIPEQWAKPVLDATVLPIHAQATCQAETLDCSLDQVNASAPDTDNGAYNAGDPLNVNPALPIPGPNGSVQIRRWADAPNEGTVGIIACGAETTGVGFVPSGSFLFTATVDPACGPVDLEADISNNTGDDGDAGGTLWSLSSGGNQTGVVDPNSGAVAFNNVVVNFTPPATISDRGDRDAIMSVRIATPGLSDCVIDLTFTEDFNCD